MKNRVLSGPLLFHLFPDRPVQRSPRAKAVFFMIEIRGLSQIYQGAQGPVEALRGIDLHIQAGEVFGIIGKSGAGKSSLVRTINLLNRPSSGAVIVHGRDLTQLNDADLRTARRDIGMVFQHFNLLSSRTVFDNAALPLELAGMSKAAIRQRVEPLLELVGLSALAGRYPAQISGGQKQRVGIARALASQPKVLLSDEATSALDPETTRSILALLRKVNREMGLTVVLITHQMQVIKDVADRVAVMDAGRIVEIGPVLQVFTHPQQAITKSLIDEIVPQELPASVLTRVQALSAQLSSSSSSVSGQLLRLSYAGESAYQPILSHLIRELGLDLSILHGQIDEIQGQTFGSLAVFASGANAQIHNAIAYLRSQGVQVEVVEAGDMPATQGVSDV
jgi:D-methionine transport system ATP-binding protein